MISELSWSEYSLVEDAFGDPNTPVARKNLDFHHPLPNQLEKIMHEIKGGIYHEDSGTHSDMDSLSSEADVKMTKEEELNGEGCQMAGDFSIEVGGFAITCEPNDEINAKKSDYMYEIGTKHSDELTNETKWVARGDIRVENKTKTSEGADGPQEAVSLPPSAPSTQPTARPRSAPTFSSLQQRRSARIQLKSLSTTSLPSQQLMTAIKQEKILADYKTVSMNDQFPKWLYSEVVKVGIQYTKPSFIRSNSSSSLSSSCSDPESHMDDDGIATDSSDQPALMQIESAAVDTSCSTMCHTTSSVASIRQSSARDDGIDQFDHHEAICYLWRGILY